MRPAYKQRVREFVKGGRATLVNHSLDGACASRTLKIGLRWTRIVNYSRRALLFPYRRVFRCAAQYGHTGIIEPFSQVDMQKESLRTGGFGGCYSRYFAGGFALRRC